MEQHNRWFKGIWIPVEIWEHPELGTNDRVIWAEINAMSDYEKGRPCQASNAYMAELLKVSRSTVTRSINKLIKMGLVLQKGPSNYQRKLYALPVPKKSGLQCGKVTLIQNESVLSQNESVEAQNDEAEAQNEPQVNNREYLDNINNNNNNKSEVLENIENEKRKGTLMEMDRGGGWPFSKKIKKEEVPRLFEETLEGQDFSCFESHFDPAIRREVNLYLYWKRALRWGKRKGVRLENWIEQIESWMEKDLAAGTLVKNGHSNNGKPMVSKNKSHAYRKGGLIDPTQARRIADWLRQRKNGFC